jgi:ankyrin repeat protein
MKLKMMDLLIVYGVDVNAKSQVHGAALIAAIED